MHILNDYFNLIRPLGNSYLSVNINMMHALVRIPQWHVFCWHIFYSDHYIVLSTQDWINDSLCKQVWEILQGPLFVYMIDTFQRKGFASQKMIIST